MLVFIVDLLIAMLIVSGALYGIVIWCRLGVSEGDGKERIMKLTKDEVEAIRIHMNAFKEDLCNQGRWVEAQEYQDIVDKLDGLLTAESVTRCKDCKYYKKNTLVCGRYGLEDDDYCSWAERKES